MEWLEVSNQLVPSGIGWYKEAEYEENTVLCVFAKIPLERIPKDMLLGWTPQNVANWPDEFTKIK